MEKVFLGDTGHNSLIILFLGWGFSPDSFAGIRKPGFDILSVRGYEGLSGNMIDEEIRAFLKERDSAYSEVVVIAWSFGVKAAAAFLENTTIPVTLSLAVNGTEYHIDNDRGIPRAIFKGTLEGLSDRTFEKFRLRCAGSWAKLRQLDVDGNTNDIDALRRELEWFASLPPVPPARRYSIWDKVVIGENDRIFPVNNQTKAWEGYDIFVIPGMEHVPDFQWLVDTFIVDKTKVADKFTTALDSYTENAVAQQATARKLFDKFVSVFHNSEPERATGKLSLLELGYGDGTFTRTYLRSLSPRCEAVTLSDIGRCADSSWVTDEIPPHCDVNLEILRGDAESEEFQETAIKGNSRDLIFSASMFQWLNSPRQMLKRCAAALRHGGIIALSFYGPETLREISATVGSGLKYPSPDWMRRVAEESGLRIESMDVEEETIHFDTPADALRHLRLTGVNALPGNHSPARTRLLLRNWPLTSDGHATLTFQPVYMILSKPYAEA